MVKTPVVKALRISAITLTKYNAKTYRADSADNNILKEELYNIFFVLKTKL